MDAMNSQPNSREFEYWTPEPIFKGETVFCLASGPSLTQEVADRIKGHRAIVVNGSCSRAPWADVLYFTDSGWFETGRHPNFCGNNRGTDDQWPRRSIVENWPGLVITMSKSAKRVLPDKVRRIQGIGDPTIGCGSFPPLGSAGVRQGRSSGHTAISIAVALGARRVILIGYDMRVVDGVEHHHSEYTGPRDLDQYAREFVPAFNGWNADALKVGVEILNATPLSAVHEFPMISLDEALSCETS
jgi:hypothetical protein